MRDVLLQDAPSLVKRKAIEQLNELQNMNSAFGGDHARNHQQADQVLCTFLVALGYSDVVEAYNKVQPTKAGHLW